MKPITRLFTRRLWRKHQTRLPPSLPWYHCKKSLATSSLWPAPIWLGLALTSLEMADISLWASAFLSSSLCLLLKPNSLLRARLGKRPFIFGKPSKISVTNNTPQLKSTGTGMYAVGENPVRRKFSRHIDIRRYFVRELVKAGIVKFTPLCTHKMVADALTKSLPSSASGLVAGVSQQASIYASTYLPTYLPMYPFIYVSTSIYLPIYASIHLSIYLLIDLSLYASIYLFISLSFYLFIYPSIYLSIFWSIHSPQLSTAVSVPMPDSFWKGFRKSFWA